MIAGLSGGFSEKREIISQLIPQIESLIQPTENLHYKDRQFPVK